MEEAADPAEIRTSQDRTKLSRKGILEK